MAASNFCIDSAARVLEERLKSRPGHFLAPALLANQLEIFEPPGDVLTLNCEKPPVKSWRS